MQFVEHIGRFCGRNSTSGVKLSHSDRVGHKAVQRIAAGPFLLDHWSVRLTIVLVTYSKIVEFASPAVKVLIIFVVVLNDL